MFSRIRKNQRNTTESPGFRNYNPGDSEFATRLADLNLIGPSSLPPALRPRVHAGSTPFAGETFLPQQGTD